MPNGRKDQYLICKTFIQIKRQHNRKKKNINNHKIYKIMLTNNKINTNY